MLSLAGLAVLMAQGSDAIIVDHLIAVARNSISVRLGRFSFGDRRSAR